MKSILTDFLYPTCIQRFLSLQSGGLFGSTPATSQGGGLFGSNNASSSGFGFSGTTGGFGTNAQAVS